MTTAEEETMTAYDEFAAYVGEINDLLCTINTLTWNARTQMPPGGAETRWPAAGDAVAAWRRSALLAHRWAASSMRPRWM